MQQQLCEIYKLQIYVIHVTILDNKYTIQQPCLRKIISNQFLYKARQACPIDLVGFDPDQAPI